MVMEVEFYETSKGRQPAREFLENLSIKDRAKMLAVIKKLAENGNMLRRPYSGLLRNSILELRVCGENNQLRILYFFFVSNKAILSHGFVKKSSKVPELEIDKAIKNKKDYERRYENEQRH